jgi:putative hydrolase of the HAD superfamily
MCDLDDTLVERPPLFRAWAERFVEDQGSSADLVEWLIEQDRGGHRPRGEFHAAIAERTGYAVPLDEFERGFSDQIGASYRLTPGVRSALGDARAAGWSVAVVTNGPTSTQDQKVRATGLEGLADAVCVAGEVGASKPDPLMFTEAARRAGTTLEGAWMIGDNLDADIAGAQAVGARTVWIKREYDWLTYASGVEPDLVAADFPEAVRRLLELTGSAPVGA